MKREFTKKKSRGSARINSSKNGETAQIPLAGNIQSLREDSEKNKKKR